MGKTAHICTFIFKKTLGFPKESHDAHCSTPHKVTVANSMAYEIFFGVTDTEIASAAKQLTDALGCSSLVLVQSAKKVAAKRPAAAAIGAMESTDPKAKAVCERPAAATSDVTTEKGPE